MRGISIREWNVQFPIQLWRCLQFDHVGDGHAHPPAPALLWKHDLALERTFAAAGGLLLSGPDPTGAGDVLPGFGDQRGVELLVEAGFSPLEAIRISTLNGAIYLGRDKEIGTVAVGKNADLVVIRGDPSKQISDIENVEIVFKDGIGYDSQEAVEFR